MAPLEVVGAIDQGTQSSRFTLFDRSCAPVAASQVKLQQVYPKAGWVEQDPEAIWGSVVEAIRLALARAAEAHGPKGVAVRAVGITNQRETTVVWDRATGRPLTNAIVWLDNRTADTCRRLTRELGGADHFRPITGLPVSTYFSAYKLKWLLDSCPAVAAAAAEGRCMFGTVDSWLMYRLTGGAEGGIHATDVTNASRTNLMELATLAWHAPTLAAFGVSPDTLPAIHSNAEVFGHVREPAELAGVPISGCLGDQQAAMLGQRCAVHEAKNTYGTGCFMLLNTGPEVVRSTHGLLTTVAYRLGPHAAPCYALEGSIAIAGQGISWLKDAMGLIGSAAESEVVSGSVPDCAGVYFVPAFGGLLAPWWRNDARGAILGLTQYTTKAHIVRAVLEAICFQTRDVLEAMKEDTDMHDLKAMFVDGGACHNSLLMQMQADILQVPVRRPANLETTSLGAALAAGIGVGFWTTEEVFADLKHGSSGTLFEPAIPRAVADRRHALWKRAVEHSFGLDELTGDGNGGGNGAYGNSGATGAGAGAAAAAEAANGTLA